MSLVKWSLVCTALLASLVGQVTEASPFQSPLINLSAAGSIGTQAIGFNPTGSPMFSSPATTLTTDVYDIQGPGNVLLGGEILNLAAFGVDPGIFEYAPITPITALVTFTNMTGSFAFDANGAGSGSIDFPLTNADYGLIFVGNLRGNGYQTTPAVFALFFDSQTFQYGTYSWYLATETPVPEPSTWLLGGLAAAGLVWHRRRQRVA